MIKVKDGYAKLIGTTYKGSPDRVLLSNGGDKPLSDFATASGVVTALGTNGNYITWTKNGTVNNLTVPYATNADKIDGKDESDLFVSQRGLANVDYIDLTSYTSGNANYKLYDSGIYTVPRSDHSDAYIVFKSRGSTSAVELMTSYQDTARLKLRKTVDNTRVSGPWRELAFTSDVPTKISQLTNDSGYLTSTNLTNYVTLNNNLTISGVKTFSTQLKFTVADGTAPFTVTSKTKVDNLNADLLDGSPSSSFIKSYESVNEVNMDTIKTPGFYYGYNMTNSAASNISTFIVTKYSGDWGSQIQLNAQLSKMYVRFWRNAGGIMEDWKKVAFTDGNIASSTITGDDTMTIIPLLHNEINFGGTNNSLKIYFGYRATDSKPIPTSFIFGGSDGSASLSASKFIKSGGTAALLLRADGNVATFNWSGQSGQPTWLWGGDTQHTYYVYNPANFSVNYATSAGNADTLDGEHGSRYTLTLGGPNYVTITVEGDAATYYPVIIKSVSNKYPMLFVNISRGYSETAPDSWNNSTHKGGLTLTLLWNGSRYWDGNGSGQTCYCVYVYEVYCTMVGGLGNSTAGKVVWLRGGGAVYHIHAMNGTSVTADVHTSTYTDSAKLSFAPRTTVESYDVRWPGYSYGADKLGSSTIGGTYLPIYLSSGAATAGTSYAKAIKAITRSGTTFTYTCIDGTTGTFTQLDSNTTYPVYFKNITTGFKDAFRTQTKGDANSGNYISAIRCDTASIENAPQDSSGIAFGMGDTHGYLYTNYGAANAFIGGGNVNKLNWIKQLAFIDSNITGNAATATNADKLDGLHAKDFVKYFVGTSVAEVQSSSLGYGQTEFGSKVNGLLLTGLYLDGKYGGQINGNAGGTELYYRGKTGSRWTTWKQLAFTDSNVASATKLQTTRKIWGLDFNGTLNVTGNMNGVGTINNRLLLDGSGNAQVHITGVTANTDYIKLQIDGANNNGRNLILQTDGGNVGIGTDSPLYKLHVAGITSTNLLFIGGSSHPMIIGNESLLSLGAANSNSKASVVLDLNTDSFRRNSASTTISLGTADYPWANIYGNNITITDNYYIKSSSGYAIVGAGTSSGFTGGLDSTSIIVGGSNLPTIIRTSADNLYHYRGDTGIRHTILDAYNYTNYTLPIISLYNDSDKLLSTKTWSVGSTCKGDQSTQTECPTLYGMYMSLQNNTSKNQGYQLFGDTWTDGRLYVRYRKAGDSNTVYNNWNQIAFTSDIPTSYSWSGSSPLDIILANYGTMAANLFISAYLIHGSGSIAMGYKISGYENTPYGGWFGATYSSPWFIGASCGIWTLLNIMTDTNYTSYTVKKDGTGASGTWGINITGNAGSVKGSYTSNGGQQNPNYFGKNKVGFLMMNTTVNNNSSYKDWMIMDCYAGSDAGGAVAFGVNRQSLGAYIMRSASERTSWTESAELLGTHNYNNYALSLSGGTLSGDVTISKESARYIVNNSSGTYKGFFGLSGNDTLGIWSGTYNEWLLTLYNGNIILGQQKKLKVGIWKDTPLYTLDVGGSIGAQTITATEEITAYSDRRLKSNIKPLENRGYIQPMTYIKDNKECIGFIAQDVLEKYPELVNDNNEYLSLNYLQYVAVLQALIIELEKRIKELENGIRKL